MFEIAMISRLKKNSGSRLTRHFLTRQRSGLFLVNWQLGCEAHCRSENFDWPRLNRPIISI